MQLTQVATRWSLGRLGGPSRFKDIFPRDEAIAAIQAAAQAKAAAGQDGLGKGISEDFVAAIAAIEGFATQAVVQEQQHKQLWYHTLHHARTVKRRALQIFEQVEPVWRVGHRSPLDAIAPERAAYLIGAGAMAHDMVQEFLPDALPYGPRRREIGTSETATIHKLLRYIAQTSDSRQSFTFTPSASSSICAVLSPHDCQILSQAIEATICCYDPETGAFYQPLLYEPERPLSLVARMVALADLGGLGIDGPEVYIQESRQVFLEENPDTLAILRDNAIPNGISRDWLWENLRQRLLRQARGQIQFARERLNRCDRELQGLPHPAIHAVRHQVFCHLNEATIRHLGRIIPVAEDTSLDELIRFFGLDRWD